MDYYEVLQVQREASQDDIKKSYQKLILCHHPDKNQEKEGNFDEFLKIDEAYKILKDPTTRKEYDSKRFQESTRCQMIIHDTLNKREFLYDESNELHYHVCKCGGWYVLDEQSEEDDYIICCDECSLVIKVLNKESQS